MSKRSATCAGVRVEKSRASKAAAGHGTDDNRLPHRPGRRTPAACWWPSSGQCRPAARMSWRAGAIETLMARLPASGSLDSQVRVIRCGSSAAAAVPNGADRTAWIRSGRRSPRGASLLPLLCDRVAVLGHSCGATPRSSSTRTRNHSDWVSALIYVSGQPPWGSALRWPVLTHDRPMRAGPDPSSEPDGTLPRPKTVQSQPSCRWSAELHMSRGHASCRGHAHSVVGVSHHCL